MRVRIIKNGFSLHHGWLRKESHGWGDLKGIAAVWQARKTYQHLSLILVLEDLTRRVVSEHAPGFDRFEEALAKQVPAWPKDWRQRVEEDETDVPQTLWGGMD